MHEARLAAAIAAAIRDAGLAGLPVRVLVSGGHDEPSAFDEALRFHLSSALPETDPALVAIIHEPTQQWCPACGRAFRAVRGRPCPGCGGAGLPVKIDEEIVIEPGVGPGPSDPPIGDGGPSADRAAAAQADPMEGSGSGASAGDVPRRPDGQVV
jgi:hypothetical protein